MQLHEIKTKKKKKAKRVGRGGKRGTFSGRGMKGQKSRAGHRMEPSIRGLIKRYAKLKGYRFNPRKTEKPVAVNISSIERAGLDEVSPKLLLEKGIIRRIKGRTPKVKLLAKGDVAKKLSVSGCLVSKAAKDKIEKAGGSIN